MANKGFSHIGLSTLDLDKTRDFYEDILGFKTVRYDTIEFKEGGTMRHAIMDCGRDQLIGLHGAARSAGDSAEYDAGINRGLGVPSGFLPFRLRSRQLRQRLQAKRKELVAKGVQVTEVTDHDWAKSIYFKDPNGIR